MLLEGKTAAVFGVANKRSIAWAITQALQKEGARIALTYQGERIEESVRELASSLRNPILLPCDVTKKEEIENVFKNLESSFGHLDILVHSIAFAKKEELEGLFINTSREGFRIALDISAYSLVSLVKYALPLLEKKGGSVLSLTYLGGYKVVPHYNVMGVAKAALETSIRYLAYELGSKNIRVNGISAGPINTLAARGISGFSKMLEVYRDRAPLKRNVSAQEVADTGLFLASDLSKGITGELIYVDAGYHITGI